MRPVSCRKRCEEDDVKSVQRVCNVNVTKNGVIIPKTPVTPIVYWGDRSRRDDPVLVRAGLKWPTSSDKRCHNCAHFFEGIPVPLPVSRDELRQVYFCEGQFCSWQCAKSFNMRETSPAGRGERNMYIALLAYKMWVKVIERGIDPEFRAKMKRYCDYRIDPAPPRSNLVDFGGKMTIEEYRKDFCGIVPPTEAIQGMELTTNARQMATLPFIDTSSTDSFATASVKKRVDGSGVFSTGTMRLEKNPAQEFNNAFVDRLKRAKLDPAIMTRKKKLETPNSLLSSMGIEIKKRSR